MLISMGNKIPIDFAQSQSVLKTQKNTQKLCHVDMDKNYKVIEYFTPLKESAYLMVSDERVEFLLGTENFGSFYKLKYVGEKLEFVDAGYFGTGMWQQKAPFTFNSKKDMLLSLRSLIQIENDPKRKQILEVMYNGVQALIDAKDRPRIEKENAGFLDKHLSSAYIKNIREQFDFSTHIVKNITGVTVSLPAIIAIKDDYRFKEKTVIFKIAVWSGKVFTYEIKEYGEKYECKEVGLFSDNIFGTNEKHKREEITKKDQQTILTVLNSISEILKQRKNINPRYKKAIEVMRKGIIDLKTKD